MDLKEEVCDNQSHRQILKTDAAASNLVPAPSKAQFSS
jgi:hypothetical protein